MRSGVSVSRSLELSAVGTRQLTLEIDVANDPTAGSARQPVFSDGEGLRKVFIYDCYKGN